MLNGVLAAQLVSTGQSSLLAHLLLEPLATGLPAPLKALSPTELHLWPLLPFQSQSSLLLQSVGKAEEGDTEH